MPEDVRSSGDEEWKFRKRNALPKSGTFVRVIPLTVAGGWIEGRRRRARFGQVSPQSQLVSQEGPVSGLLDQAAKEGDSYILFC